MTIYNEILSQVEQLQPDEQLRLIEDLAALVRRQVAATSQDSLQTRPLPNLDQWFGFLSQPIDALAFQLQIRQEWNREVWHES
ncbi:MAG TPA: hypothetical protein DD379_04475 [Cyanobacteria bacterium UBA11162]|nr:hypothetical protein [Cyanobacteria bacterium UBA11162]